MIRSTRLAAILALCCVAVLVSVLDAQTAKPRKPAGKKKSTPVTMAQPAAPVAAVEPAPPPEPTDLRIHTKVQTGAEMSGNTTLIKGARQRIEFPGMVVIRQCDTGRTFQLSEASKRYIVRASAPAAAAQPVPATDPNAAVVAQMQQMQAAQMGQMGKPASKGGVITWTTTLTDTGERKDIAGREARHIKTVTTVEASPNACNKPTERVEVDGWYVDLTDVPSCAMPTAKAEQPPVAEGACTDHVVSRTTGNAKLGFPVQTTTITTSGTDADTTSTSMTMEVDRLEVTLLDASLFDVPPHYTEAKSYNELLPSLGEGGTLSDALLGSVADGTRQVLPKEVGKVRIGIVEPANSSGRQVSSRHVQQEMTGNFTKHPYEGVPLFGATPEALKQDAAAKECDYILITTLAEAKTSKPGKVGGFLKAASGDGPPKDNHEVKIDYKLFAVDGLRSRAPPPPRRRRAVAGSDSSRP